MPPPLLKINQASEAAVGFMGFTCIPHSEQSIQLAQLLSERFEQFVCWISSNKLLLHWYMVLLSKSVTTVWSLWVRAVGWPDEEAIMIPIRCVSQPDPLKVYTDLLTVGRLFWPAWLHAFWDIAYGHRWSRKGNTALFPWCSGVPVRQAMIRYFVNWWKKSKSYYLHQDINSSIESIIRYSSMIRA